ncbi:MAG: hypothetical protein KC933_31395 [Myxococcales bacterium]|nr:hypothetical protein [Myxococcales bacterium]
MTRTTLQRPAQTNFAANAQAVNAAAKPQATTEAQPVEEAGVRAHLSKFFDTDRDRRITYPETFSGLRRLGLGRMAAAGAALAINVGLGRTTGGSLTTVNLDGIAKGKHAGDSGIINAEGGFVEEKFDALFRDYAKTYPDALTQDEVIKFRQDNLAKDPKATGADKVAVLGEFGLLFRFGAQQRDGQPVLTRERLFDFYHGDLFQTLAQEHTAKREARAGTFNGWLQNTFNTWIF